MDKAKDVGRTRNGQGPCADEADGPAAAATSAADRRDAVPKDSFQGLIENLTDHALYVLNQSGQVTYWNTGAELLFGYAREEISGSHFERFYAERDCLDGRPRRLLQIARKDGRIEEEGWRVRKDGTKFWANTVINCIRGSEGRSVEFACIERDISERRRSQERLGYLAHYDVMTKLRNRFSFGGQLERIARAGAPYTLLMLDLDDFSSVNDTLGHAAGDFVLRSAAARIERCVGSKGIVGRLGGDEFGVVLPGVSEPSEVAETCRALIEAFDAPLPWEGHDTYLGLSIGCATGPRDGDPTNLLLSNADLALSRAKSEGGRGYFHFRPELRDAAVARKACESGLRAAVVEGQLELHYQPQVLLPERRVVGAEALLRWRHPEQGLLRPAAFMPVLASSLLAASVGDWAIFEACAHVAAVRRLGFEDYRVGVNLFGAQLKERRLPSTVTAALSEYGLPFDALELEITEDIFLRHDDESLSHLKQLRAMGVGISFDDFGTGYASLSLLRSFPLTRLKTDRSFTANVCTSPRDRALVEAIVSLGRTFDLSVIAEGVETQGQESALVNLGCRLGQGYLYGEPMTSSEALAGISRQACPVEDRSNACERRVRLPHPSEGLRR